MNKQEWEVFKSLLQKIGVKPHVVESRNGQGELLGYVVRLQADSVKFRVDMAESAQPQKQFAPAEKPKKVRK